MGAIADCAAKTPESQAQDLIPVERAKPTDNGKSPLFFPIIKLFIGTVVMAKRTARLIVGVDDDLRIRESLQSLIESAEFAYCVFPSAEEFLESGKLAEASCVITDIRMSGMNGIELQLRVRRDRPDLPLIFVSGHFNDETRRKALAGGAFALIEKPFDGNDLLATVHRAISKVPGG
jgi:FixJ family two-component response regulator